MIALWVVTLAPAVVFSQSLVDTAKAEQARRKKAAPAGTPKVYTETDLPASPTKTEPEPKATKTSAAPAPKKGAPPGLISEADRQRTELASREMELTNLITHLEEVVQRLAKQPTGGGKVCPIPEGAFKPGETAPSSVVCPYQMESRYDQAKRQLDEAKALLAVVQDDARRLAGKR